MHLPQEILVAITLNSIGGQVFVSSSPSAPKTPTTNDYTCNGYTVPGASIVGDSFTKATTANDCARYTSCTTASGDCLHWNLTADNSHQYFFTGLEKSSGKVKVCDAVDGTDQVPCQ